MYPYGPNGMPSDRVQQQRMFRVGMPYPAYQPPQYIEPPRPDNDAHPSNRECDDPRERMRDQIQRTMGGQRPRYGRGSMMPLPYQPPQYIEPSRSEGRYGSGGTGGRDDDYDYDDRRSQREPSRYDPPAPREPSHYPREPYNDVPAPRAPYHHFRGPSRYNEAPAPRAPSHYSRQPSRYDDAPPSHHSREPSRYNDAPAPRRDQSHHSREPSAAPSAREDPRDYLLARMFYGRRYEQMRRER